VLVRLDKVLQGVTEQQRHQRAVAAAVVQVQWVPLVILAALPVVLVCLRLLQEPLFSVEVAVEEVTTALERRVLAALAVVVLVAQGLAAVL
jgi:hypothetical protein